MAAGNRKEVGEEAAEVEEVACLINNLSIDSLLSFIRSVSFQSCFYCRRRRRREIGSWRFRLEMEFDFISGGLPPSPDVRTWIINSLLLLLLPPPHKKMSVIDSVLLTWMLYANEAPGGGRGGAFQCPSCRRRPLDGVGVAKPSRKERHSRIKEGNVGMKVGGSTSSLTSFLLEIVVSFLPFFL